MRRALLLTALVLAVHTVGVQAQDGWLTPGRQLRITAPGHNYASRPARLVAVRGDTLVLEHLTPRGTEAGHSVDR